MILGWPKHLELEEAKQRFKNETNSASAFINALLTKSENMEERLKLSQVYDDYKAFCTSEGYLETETKEGLKRALKGSGFTIDRSSKDGNQVHVFGVKLNANLE